jgi:hypothetical protein
MTVAPVAFIMAKKQFWPVKIKVRPYVSHLFIQAAFSRELRIQTEGMCCSTKLAEYLAALSKELFVKIIEFSCSLVATTGEALRSCQRCSSVVCTRSLRVTKPTTRL